MKPSSTCILECGTPSLDCCSFYCQVESRGLFVYLNSYYAKVCVAVVRDDVNYGSKNWVVISLVKHGIENI